MQADVLLEGLLFYTAVPQSKTKIAAQLGLSDEQLAEASRALRLRLESGAIRLLETESELQLVTAPALSVLINGLRQRELSQDIGRAGAETLAIVLYREPVSRAEIDQIRGVNSAFILRNLLTRGLIERRAVKNSHEFRVTPALLQHLGITQKEALPQYADFMERIAGFNQSQV